MARMRPPKVPEQPVAVLTLDEQRRLLATCEGRSFVDRRDAAMLRVFIDTGARLAEVAGLLVATIELDDGMLLVMGKGRRERRLPIGSRTVKALDRYLPRAVPAPRRVGAKALARQEGPYDGKRDRADDAAPCWAGGRGGPSPPSVPPHLRP